MNPPAPNPTLIYAVPALYVNFASFTYINGVFRMTFFEQHLTGTPGTPEVTETLAPRVAVVMVPGVAAELLKAFGDLYNQVAKSVITAAATTLPDEGGGGRPN